MSLNLDKTAWKRVRFGDVADRSREQVDQSTGTIERYVAGGHFPDDALEVVDFGVPDDGGMGSTFTYAFHPGQVLYVSASWYLRKVAVATFDGVVADKTYVIETRDAEVLDPRFLPWILLSDDLLAYAGEQATGSMNARLLWSTLANYEFDLPPVDVQGRIATLLWSVEGHRAALAAERDAVRQATDEMFSAALAAHEGSAVAVPELLEVMTVGVVVKPTQYYTDNPDGVPALRGLNVLPGGFDLTDLVRFRPESARELSKSTLRLGDVVVVRTGRPGDAAVVDERVAGANCIDMIITRPGTGLSSAFFANYLNSSYGRAQIARLSAGTAQQHFNVGALKKLTIPAVSRAEQEAIVSDVRMASAAADAVGEELRALDAVRTTILAEVFGETR